MLTATRIHPTVLFHGMKSPVTLSQSGSAGRCDDDVGRITGVFPDLGVKVGLGVIVGGIGVFVAVGVGVGVKVGWMTSFCPS